MQHRRRRSIARLNGARPQVPQRDMQVVVIPGLDLRKRIPLARHPASFAIAAVTARIHISDQHAPPDAAADSDASAAAKRVPHAAVT